MLTHWHISFCCPASKEGGALVDSLNMAETITHGPNGVLECDIIENLNKLKNYHAL